MCTVLAHLRGAPDVVHRHGLCCETAVRGGPIPVHHQTVRAREHKGEHRMDHVKQLFVSTSATKMLWSVLFNSGQFSIFQENNSIILFLLIDLRLLIYCFCCFTTIKVNNWTSLYYPESQSCLYHKCSSLLMRLDLQGNGGWTQNLKKLEIRFWLFGCAICLRNHTVM